MTVYGLTTSNLARAPPFCGHRHRMLSLTCDDQKPLHLRAFGKSLARIAEELRLSKTTVPRLLARGTVMPLGYKKLRPGGSVSRSRPA